MTRERRGGNGGGEGEEAIGLWEKREVRVSDVLVVGMKEACLPQMGHLKRNEVELCRRRIKKWI